MPTYPRQHLQQIYQHALNTVNGRAQVVRYLKNHTFPTPIAAVAIGKAATEMLAGAFDVLGADLTHALLITKTGHFDPSLLQARPVTCIESAHPVPDQRSLDAGHQLLDFLVALPTELPVLFLISGGTSALAEVLAPNVTLADLQRLNQWLLGSGLDIHAVNTVRKQLSAIKAGRLATYLHNRTVWNLLISDVPNDDVRAIGSGLLVPHTEMALPANLPTWLHKLITNALPLSPATAFQTIHTDLLTTPATARQAAAMQAQQLGYSVIVADELLTGDALVTGQQLVAQLANAVPGVYIWSAETTVTLPPQPGQGGRCQSLALAAAIAMQGKTNMLLFAVGTDGNDGPGNIAGALVDGNTVQRGEQVGLNAQQALQAADAGTFLAASQDLVVTGPTGTNVMDLVIVLVTEPRMDANEHK